MSLSSIVASRTDGPLQAAPIDPTWIVDGTPTARTLELSRSSDGMATTLVWECTEGKFDWFYDVDETICILEGSVVIGSDTLQPTRYGPGDVVFFRCGARARWHVEGYVRKIAFCRRVQPRIVAIALRAAARLNRLVSARQAVPSLMDAGRQPAV